MKKLAKTSIIVICSLLLITGAIFTFLNLTKFFDAQASVNQRQALIDYQLNDLGLEPEDIPEDYILLAVSQELVDLYGNRTLIFGLFSIMTILNLVVFINIRIDENQHNE